MSCVILSGSKRYAVCQIEISCLCSKNFIFFDLIIISISRHCYVQYLNQMFKSIRCVSMEQWKCIDGTIRFSSICRDRSTVSAAEMIVAIFLVCVVATAQAAVTQGTFSTRVDHTRAQDARRTEFVSKSKSHIYRRKISILFVYRHIFRILNISHPVVHSTFTSKNPVTSNGSNMA